MVRPPSDTSYVSGSSRTIAFHRHCSRAVPSNSSDGSIEPPAPSGSNRIQSNVAVGLVVVTMPEIAVGPTLGDGRVLIGAGRPTGLNVSPSVEYDARRSVPLEVSRT